MSGWRVRLEQACTGHRFREFVQQNVLDWCKWRWEASKEIARLQQATAEETPDEQAARWAAADELECNPRFRPAAVADDQRLTLDAKCALVAIWWYRERGSEALCPAPGTSPDTMSGTAPLEVILRIIDADHDGAAIAFTDIGAIAVDVLDTFDGKLQLCPTEYQKLSVFAKQKLSGIQRRLVELLIENGGSLPIKDIATDPAINWIPDYGRYDSQYQSLTKTLNPKLHRIGWHVRRSKSCALLERFSAGKNYGTNATTLPYQLP